MVLYRFEVALKDVRYVVDLPRAGKVTIGRSPRHTICLDDCSVSMDHATLVVSAGSCLISSVNRTIVNGTPISEGELKDGDVLQLGTATMKLFEIPEMAREERGFVAEVHEGGDEARQVYADWLETVGRRDEAMWLRAEISWHARSEPSRELHRAELERLSSRVGAAFRALLSRPRIEACFRSECPREWASLLAGNDERVRHCGVCDTDVRFCDTVQEAQQRSRAGVYGETRFVVDPSRRREEQDLWPRHHLG
jgi:uncharacterized protein (TIGR02996 family)